MCVLYDQNLKVLIAVDQIEIFDIDNPCKGICENGPRGYCRGCFRSREERQHWNVLGQSVRYKIIKACALRERRLNMKKSEDLNDDVSSSQPDLF